MHMKRAMRSALAKVSVCLCELHMAKSNKIYSYEIYNSSI